MIRIFDILISLFLLMLFLPIIIIVSIFIVLVDGRPILYKQLRIGYMGKKFFMFKFRTMTNYVYKSEERRLTKFGKFLRRTSLDEIPQFINVLKKEMSIVGPRPLPELIEKRITKNSKIKRRKIYPGLTGMSQVNYSGRNRKLNEKIKLDLWLVDNLNFHNYLKILFRTPLVIFVRFIKNKSSIIK